MFLLQMSGQPGSGKSTLAREISKNLEAIIIDNDIIKSAVLELDIEEISLDIAGKLTYNINFRLAEYYLKQGKTVIIDAPCRFQFIVDRGNKLSLEHGAKYKYIECYINNYKETERRLKQRDRLLSQIDESKVEKNNYEDWLSQAVFPNDKYLKVETNQPVEKYLKKCISYINT